MDQTSRPVTTSEINSLRREVRGFLAAFRREGRFTPTVDCWVRGWDDEFSKELGRRGYLAMTVPTAYGGQGRTHLERFVVTEELLAAGAPVAAHWIADRQVAPSLLAHGTEEQKREYLPRIAAGECYFGIGMSEPDSGSDLASVRTKGVKVDGGYRITGSKVWTSGAHRAEAFFVLTRTTPLGDGGKHEGLSQFIVPLDSPGVEVRPIVSADGLHHFNEVFLDEVFVADSAVLGRIGDGWKQVTSELSFERSGPERFMSTYVLLESLIAEGRVQEHGSRQLGRIASRLAALHTLSFGVAQRLHRGGPADTDAALVKLLGTEFEGDVVAWAADEMDGQAHDPMGFIGQQLRIAQVQRAGFTLRGGTSEVLRGVVTRGLTV
ncbi:acyl-CoA dehydrogenase family protein [Actinomadura alba]|nr:acyl-CoA dehydrogenase family protein [Actinomadura alba]